jgi:GAF domain-containing protein
LTPSNGSEELEALREISLAVTAQLELDEVLRDVVERGCRLLEVGAGSIDLVDEGRGDLELVVSRGYTRDHTGTRLVPGEGIAGKVLQSGAPLTVDDYRHWEGRSPDWEAEPLTAALGVPLKRGEQVIGVLSFAEVAQAGGFDEHDVWLATLFANQAAIAIENARLYQAEQAARENADTLREISRAVGSTLELDEVLSLVLRQAKRVLTYDTASILLFAGGEPAMAAVSGYEDEELVRTEVSLRLDDSLILQAMARDHLPVVIADVREDERWIWVPGTEDIRAWIGVPLWVCDEMIGALMIDSTQPGLYTEADAAIITAASAPIHLDEILQRTLDALCATLRPDDAAILLLEPETKELVVRAWIGFPGGPTLMRRSVGVGAPGWVVQTGEAVLLADVRQDDRYHACDADTRSESPPWPATSRYSSSVHACSRR